MLAKRFCKDEMHNEKIALIRSTVQDMIDNKHQVWSVEYVQTFLS